VSDSDWATGRSGFVPQQRKKDFFSSLCLQTGSKAHPASCPMGTAGPFPGTKARPGSRKSRSYTSSPPSAFLACSGTAEALFGICKYVFFQYLYSSLTTPPSLLLIFRQAQTMLLPYSERPSFTSIKNNKYINLFSYFIFVCIRRVDPTGRAV
jgi:hypothetical protein